VDQSGYTEERWQKDAAEYEIAATWLIQKGGRGPGSEDRNGVNCQAYGRISWMARFPDFGWGFWAGDDTKLVIFGQILVNVPWFSMVVFNSRVTLLQHHLPSGNLT